ncbi:MAG: hypothetical protein PHQ27_01725, partial [Victivallales bacterium]|nr:hypothetical protein [Victivallales bacterium]
MKEKLVILAMLLGVVGFGGTVPYEFPLLKTARLDPGTAQTDAVTINVDTDLYRAVDNFNTDVRIVDAEGREVPFAVRKYTRNQSRKEVVKIPGLIKKMRREPHRVELFVRPATVTAEDKLIGLEIVTAARNFEKQLRLAAFLGG